MLAPLYDVVPVFMDRRATHQLAFRHGAAEFAEDFDQTSLAALLADLGYRTPPVLRALKQITTLAQKIGETAPHVATKDLADALRAQARVVEAALKAQFELPDRDFFDRIVRDEAAAPAGGWGEFS